MGHDSNRNRNRHGNTDNNGQRASGVHGGEFRRGRKSMYKNNNPTGGDVPNEYISDKPPLS